jgi:hypothetical protein
LKIEKKGSLFFTKKSRTWASSGQSSEKKNIMVTPFFCATKVFRQTYP